VIRSSQQAPDDYDEEKPFCQSCGEQEHVILPDDYYAEKFEAEYSKRRTSRVLTTNRLLFLALGFTMGVLVTAYPI